MEVIVVGSWGGTQYLVCGRHSLSTSSPCDGSVSLVVEMYLTFVFSFLFSDMTQTWDQGNLLLENKKTFFLWLNSSPQPMKTTLYFFSLSFPRKEGQTILDFHHGEWLVDALPPRWSQSDSQRDQGALFTLLEINRFPMAITYPQKNLAHGDLQGQAPWEAGGRGAGVWCAAVAVSHSSRIMRWVPRVLCYISYTNRWVGLAPARQRSASRWLSFLGIGPAQRRSSGRKLRGHGSSHGDIVLPCGGNLPFSHFNCSRDAVHVNQVPCWRGHPLHCEHQALLLQLLCSRDVLPLIAQKEGICNNCHSSFPLWFLEQMFVPICTLF